MDPQDPQYFGRYRLHGLIGRGGMAEVYLGEVEGVGAFRKRVAIKRLLPHYAANRRFVTMLNDEARIAAAIRHPNVAEVLDFGVVDSTHYIAIEYVDGLDLAAILRTYRANGRLLPIEAALFIARAVADGLHAAHRLVDAQGRAQEVIHRDVSPHNILISYEGAVKLIDFGVAKATNNTTQTRSGVIKGKLQYMSPEQAQAKHIDARADVFSLGMTLFKMLTGRLPFSGENEFQIYEQILRRKVTSLRSIVSDLPEVIDAIVLKALRKDPDRRFQTAHELSRVIGVVLGQLYPEFGGPELGELLMRDVPRKAVVATPEDGEDFVTANSASVPGGPLGGQSGGLSDESGPDAAVDALVATVEPGSAESNPRTVAPNGDEDVGLDATARLSSGEALAVLGQGRRPGRVSARDGVGSGGGATASALASSDVDEATGGADPTPADHGGLSTPPRRGSGGRPRPTVPPPTPSIVGAPPVDDAEGDERPARASGRPSFHRAQTAPVAVRLDREVGSRTAEGTSAPSVQTSDLRGLRRRGMMPLLLVVIFGLAAAFGVLAWSRYHRSLRPAMADPDRTVVDEPAPALIVDTGDRWTDGGRGSVEGRGDAGEIGTGVLDAGAGRKPDGLTDSGWRRADDGAADGGAGARVGAPRVDAGEVDPGGEEEARRPDAALAGPAPTPKPKPVRTAPAAAVRRESVGYLSVNVLPWAHVEINGVRLKRHTPIQKHALRAGSHRVRLVGPDGQVWTGTVNIRAGREERLQHLFQ